MTPLAATEAERAYQAALTTYPNPNSPHGSVNERWRDDVKAYIVGYLAARALQQTAEPNFWAVLADHGDDFTGDKELADYWDRNGRTVVALYRAAPDRAPSTDSAADARDAALWIALTADIASESCKAYCFIDDMGDWQDRNRALIDAKHAELWRKLNTDAETLRECRSLLDGLTDWKRAHAASLPQTKEE